jgi:tripartite-type tricarboxylate transporter receptor subunit TctC
MLHPMRRRALLAIPALLPAVAMAQGWPARQIRIIVPYAPGGSVDALARMIARPLTDALGQPVVVENRSGAGGNIAFELVARAAPDGHTLLFTSEPLVVNPALYPGLPFDPVASFTPVNLTATLAQALVVGNAVPARDLVGLLELARARPGSVHIASGGNGTPGHLVCAMLNRAGVPVVHVPYRGGGPAAAAVLAGEVQGALVTLPGVHGLVTQGAVRAIAVSGRARATVLPEVPRIAEAVPGLVIESWHALFAPAGLPAPIRQRLHEATEAAIAEPGLRATLTRQAFEPVGGPPEALGALVGEEVAMYRFLVRDLALKLD